MFFLSDLYFFSSFDSFFQFLFMFTCFHVSDLNLSKISHGTFSVFDFWVSFVGFLLVIDAAAVVFIFIIFPNQCLLLTVTWLHLCFFISKMFPSLLCCANWLNFKIKTIINKLKFYKTLQKFLMMIECIIKWCAYV